MKRIKFLSFAKTNIKLYSFLSHLGHPKSYKGKIMLVAFVGTHIPLLTLLAYFVISSSFSWEMKVRIMLISLLATLVGTALTLYALHNLLAPVTLTFLALREYLNKKTLPNLPIKFTDEAGILMADTSYTIKKLDEVIQYMANYDGLTGLPNRVLFRDRLQQTLSQAESNNQLFAVISLSLERLQNINNTLGYSAGNVLLRNAAQRLTICIADTDILSHFGSNKFAILQPNISSIDDVITLCEKLLNTLSKPFLLEQSTVRTGISIGITVYPCDHTNVDQLLGNADTAMYQAKRLGSNNYQFHSAELNANIQERLILENELYNALKREELQLHYQPKVCLSSGCIIGVEALLRWQSPTRGFISPAKFIPLAEESGLIVPIGEWVLRTACAQNRTWQENGFPPLKMAVNLSARQFNQPNLLQKIAQILKETNLNPIYLELELTESLLVENVQQTVIILQQLHDMGIVLSLDDFGTGYSSLNYLKRFPIDVLKIDQSFVRDLVFDSDDAAITEAIISLAHSLHLRVIAEGVETEEQLNYLHANGCNEIQGYYFSRPLPADALTKLLEEGKNLSCTTKIKDLVY